MSSCIRAFENFQWQTRKGAKISSMRGTYKDRMGSTLGTHISGPNTAKHRFRHVFLIPDMRMWLPAEYAIPRSVLSGTTGSQCIVLFLSVYMWIRLVSYP